MFSIHSLSGRLFIGKLMGFLTGLLFMFMLPAFDLPVFGMFGLGTLLMFMLMGVMTGFMGLFDRHPAFDFSMKWWLRGPLVGVAFMLMYVLFTYNELTILLQSPLLSWMGFESPFWALIDGAVVGGLMGFLETKLAGEGPKLKIK